MSSVHTVVHENSRLAALKIAYTSTIGPGMSAETFLREARIAKWIEHPGVVEVQQTGSHRGRPYLIMEKLEGVSLGRRVDQGPPIRRTQAVQILLEVIDILRAAHAAGVVHRDLKLDNVFLCDEQFADTRRVKLLDWGVAYVDGEPDPFRGLIAGTLTYVAPEQIRGDALTPAADIYSLAVLAFHLLCRRPPFAGPDLTLLHLHLRVEPPPASFAWPDVPTALEDLLTRMLAKHPEERPDLDEIERVLRETLPEVEPTIRFADGSGVHFPVLPRETPEPNPWYLRWLLAKRISPAMEGDDLLERSLLPTPPFKAGWVAVGLALAGLAGLVHALS
jgi:serine/threonine protein kinase